MTITPRVIEILRLLRRYKFLTTALIRQWAIPHDADGSITRDLLRKMLAAGLARRVKAEVHDPLRTSSAPVWLPTEAGCCVLATRTGDASLLLDALPNTQAWQNFAHHVQVSEQMHTISEAFRAQTHAHMGAILFEHDIVNPDAKEPENKWRLYTLVRDGNADSKRIVCVPDAAFEVTVGEYRRAYYLEKERGNDPPKRVMAKKLPGYQGMKEHFKRHFPQAQDWRVLFVWPNSGLRDAARRAIDPTKAGAFLFASAAEIKPDTFLHGNIIYTAQGGPRPFLMPPTAAPEAAPGA